MIELFEPFARNVFGRKSGIRGCSCGLVDGRIGQFERAQVCMDGGSHRTGYVSLGYWVRPCCEDALLLLTDLLEIVSITHVMMT